MESNVAELCGVVLSDLKFSHKTYGEIFYTTAETLIAKSVPIASSAI